MDTSTAEKVLLDENALAKGHSGFDLGGFEVLQLTYNNCNWHQISVFSVHLLLPCTRNCAVAVLPSLRGTLNHTSVFPVIHLRGR